MTHTAESITQDVRSFTRSRIILTAVELDLFTRLDGVALRAEEIAAAADLDLRAVTILLDVMAAMDLLEKNDGCYRTPEALAPILSSGADVNILPSLRHSAHLWQTWSQLTDIVRHGGPAQKPRRDPGEYTAAFIGAMHVRAVREADEMVSIIGADKAERLLDVGGGSGSYTIAFLRAVPGMTATIFDLPAVIELAGERVGREGLADRVTLAAGDFSADELPGGHDLALLSAIIHMNSHQANIDLYRKVHRALAPGGRVVISDFILEPNRTAPLSAAMFAVNMLVNTGSGNAYTFKEMKDGLEEAGFHGVRIIVNDDSFNLVEGFR